jgi:hypothetical protein
MIRLIKWIKSMLLQHGTGVVTEQIGFYKNILRLYAYLGLFGILLVVSILMYCFYSIITN